MSGSMGTHKVSAWDRIMMLQPVAPIFVLVLFIISIALSALPKTSPNIILWALTGLGGVFFLRIAYPRAFGYGLWLLAIYVLSGFAMFFLNGLGLKGPQGIAVGLLLEVVAGYIVYQLLVEIKGVRDIGEGPYVPLGLWSLAVVLFFLLANGSIGSLAYWVKNGGNLYGYLGLEVLMSLVVLFVFSRAELCVIYLEEGPRAARRRAPEPTMALPEATDKVIQTARTVVTRTRKAITPGRRAVVKAEEKCPICGSHLRVVMRACPNCDEPESSAACRRSSHVFLPCPSCGRANFQGEYRCKGCNAKLTESILCRKCGKEADLVEWKTLDKERKGEGATGSDKEDGSEPSVS